MYLEGSKNHHRPRLIVWRLTRQNEQPTPDAGELTSDHAACAGDLTTNECLVIIDGLARLSKPVLVLTGDLIAHRSDLREIVAYGVAIGMKMIVEMEPEDITETLLDEYCRFGPQVLRVVIDGRIEEDFDTRFKDTERFRSLQRAISLLRKSGFDIHLALHVRHTDIRRLACCLDYAIRQFAFGLHCHLDPGTKAHVGTHTRGLSAQTRDYFIDQLSALNLYLPDEMYFSPQCVKYNYNHPGGNDNVNSELREKSQAWIHSCLAGRSFAFIDEQGKVFPCAASRAEVGNLRTSGYDFRVIWEDSDTFKELRNQLMTCDQTRQMVLRELDPQKQHECRKNVVKENSDS